MSEESKRDPLHLEDGSQITFDDIDKAMASIPKPKTFADYGKTYRVLPGGGFEEIK